MCSPGVISTCLLHRRQGGEETCLQMPTHNSMRTHSRMCAKSHSVRHTLIQRLLVLNNDMQLPRMSMSLPVFVRSYLVLLWKPNVILKNPLPLCGSPSLCREKPVHKGEPGLIPDSGCSCQTVSDDTRQRPSVCQHHAGGPGESG